VDEGGMSSRRGIREEGRWSGVSRRRPRIEVRDSAQKDREGAKKNQIQFSFPPLPPPPTITSRERHGLTDPDDIDRHPVRIRRRIRPGGCH
jgi:hypothetical protein